MVVRTRRRRKTSYLGIAWSVLTQRERRTAVILAGVLLTGTALEVLSLSLFMPLVSVLAGERTPVEYPLLSELVRGASGADGVIRVFGVLLVVFVVKSVFAAWSIWFQRGFAARIEHRLSSDLFRIYVEKPYVFHVGNNSSVLMRNIGMASQFVTFTVDSLLVLGTDGAVLTATVLLLIAVEPVGTAAVVATVLLAAGLFHRSTQDRVAKWGEERLSLEAKKIQYMQEGLGAIKEIKVLGREAEFERRFDDTVKTMTRVNQGYTTLTSLPRIWLELLTLLGMGVLVAVQVLRGRSVSETLPILGVFAAGSFKVMPSVNRIIFAVQNLRYSRPALTLLDVDMKERGLHAGTFMSRQENTDGSIEFRDVSFSYPAANTRAVSNLTFLIAKGQAVGFVGSSGAGKSTLVDLLLGLLEPQGGEIFVGGTVRREASPDRKTSFGYVPQHIFLTDDTLRNNIAFGVPEQEIDENRVLGALEQASLGELLADLPDGLDTPMGERGVRLSGGQRQRIGIARALYSDPDVLVLDEATSALDIVTEKEIINEISEMIGERTLVIVAHRFTTVSICSTVHQVEGGRIVMTGSAPSVTDAIQASQSETRSQP